MEGVGLFLAETVVDGTGDEWDGLLDCTGGVPGPVTAELLGGFCAFAEVFLTVFTTLSASDAALYGVLSRTCFDIFYVYVLCLLYEAVSEKNGRLEHRAIY